MCSSFLPFLLFFFTKLSLDQITSIFDLTVESEQVRKNAKIRNQLNQAPHPTQGTIWESDKNTRKHHMQESQEASPFPAGGHKAAMNRQDSKHKWQKRSTKESLPWNGQ